MPPPKPFLLSVLVGAALGGLTHASQRCPSGAELITAQNVNTPEIQASLGAITP
jgi:hypothetical protein